LKIPCKSKQKQTKDQKTAQHPKFLHFFTLQKTQK